MCDVLRVGLTVLTDTERMVGEAVMNDWRERRTEHNC